VVASASPSPPPLSPLRGLQVDTEGTCNQTELDAVASGLHENLRLPTCGDQTVEDLLTGLRVVMCAPGAECTDTPVLKSYSTQGANSSRSVVCSCAAGSYELPSAAHPPLAPYRASEGCVSAVWGDRLTSTHKKVLIALQKTATSTTIPSRTINLTVALNGSDWSALISSHGATLSTWQATVASTSSSIPWIFLPLEAGVLLSGEHLVDVPVNVSARGLRDREEHSATVHVDLDLLSGRQQRLSIPVSIVVRSSPVAARCTLGVTGPQLGVVGEVFSFKFTARDLEGIPLDHGGDPFAASMIPPDGTEARASLWYVANGSYAVAVPLSARGVHTIILRLQGQDLPENVTIDASCARGLVGLSDGSLGCGCAPGSTLNDDLTPLEPPCTPCPLGFWQGIAGSSECSACADPRATTLTEGVTSEASCVCNKGSYLDSDGVCSDCLAGARCDGKGTTLATIELDHGWWRTSNASSVVSPCPRTDSCLGGANATCEDGYTGVYCAVCAAGRLARRSGECEHCGSPSTSMVISSVASFGLLLVAMLLALIVTRRAKREEITVRHFMGEKLRSKMSLRKSVMEDVTGKVRSLWPIVLIKVKIVISLGQLLNQLPGVYGFSLSDEFAFFVNAFSAFSDLDLVHGVLPIMCFVSPVVANFNFHFTLFARTLLPLLLAFLFSAFAGFFSQRAHMWDNQHSPTQENGSPDEPVPVSAGAPSPTGQSTTNLLAGLSAYRTAAQPAAASVGPPTPSSEVPLRAQDASASNAQSRASRLSYAALFILFLMYPGASSDIFAVFQCERLDDGTRWLTRDYSIDCDGPSHGAASAFAAIMLLVVPLGVPLLFLILLLRKRRELRCAQAADGAASAADVAVASDSMGSLQMLTDAWKEEYYYFEVVECLRKASIVGLGVLLPPGSVVRSVGGLLVAFGSFALYALLQPYREPVDNVVQLLCQFDLFAVMLFGLVERLQQDGAAMEPHVGVLLLLLSCTPIAIGAVGVLLEVPACIRSVRELRAVWQRGRASVLQGRFSMRTSGGDEQHHRPSIGSSPSSLRPAGGATEHLTERFALRRGRNAETAWRRGTREPGHERTGLEPAQQLHALAEESSAVDAVSC
jgi:hypothetical protein